MAYCLANRGRLPLQTGDETLLGSWEWICFGVATAGLFLGASIARGAADSASGTLQIGKERFALKHAFATMEEDTLAGAGREKLTVLLSDLPVPDELRKVSNDWRNWADTQARAGSLHGVIVTIDATTRLWNRGHVLTRRGLMFYTETVTSPEKSNFRFTPAGPIGDQAGGKVSMREPMSGVQEEDGPWRVEAEFRAAVIRQAAVSAVLTGAAAQNSPQHKVVLAFVDASRKKDLEAIRKCMDPRSREALAQMIASSSKEETLNMFAELAAETTNYKLTKVTVRGDSAEVEFVDAKPGNETRQSFRVVLSNGEWKIAQ